jgi:hypothetical protein
MDGSGRDCMIGRNGEILTADQVAEWLSVSRNWAVNS